MKLFLAIAAGSVIGSLLYGTTPVACVIYAVALGLAAVVLRALWRICRNINRAINGAGKILRQGIPEPEQVRADFVRTMGREPSVTEISALHRMATSRHNQALLMVGGAVAGGVFGAHLLHETGI